MKGNTETANFPESVSPKMDISKYKPYLSQRSWALGSFDQIGGCQQLEMKAIDIT